MVKYSLLNRSCVANWTAKAILLCFTRLYILMQVVNHVEGDTICKVKTIPRSSLVSI